MIAAGFDGGHAQASRRGHGACAATRAAAEAQTQAETRGRRPGPLGRAGRRREPAARREPVTVGAQPVPAGTGSPSRRPAAAPAAPGPVRRRRPGRARLPQVADRVYSHRSTHGPVDLAFTDRYGGVSAVPFDSLNLAPRAATTTRRDRRRNLGRLLADFAPGDGRRRPAPGARRRRRRASTRRWPAAAATPTAWSPPRPASRCWSGPPTACPVLLADPDAGVVGAAHAGRPGLVAGRRRRRRVAAMRELGAGRITAWVGPHVCGALLRGARRRCATRSPPSCPPPAPTTSWGTPALDLGAGVRAQLERRSASPSSTCRRCTRESADLYSYRRDGAGAGRLAGLIRLTASTPEPRRRDRGRPRRRAPRGSPPPARDAGRDPDEVTAGRGHQVLPGLRRPAARRPRRHRRRREPPPGGRGQGRRVRRPRPHAGTSSAGCRATRRPRSRRTPTWSSPSTGAKLVAAALSGAPTSASHDRRRACSRSASTRPSAAGRSGADPADAARRWPPRSTSAGMLRLRGLMAVAPLGEDPAAAFARLAEIRARRSSPTHPDATWLSAGMSGDLEHADRAGATHVRDRLRGPRFEARGSSNVQRHEQCVRCEGRRSSGGNSS